MLKQVSRTRKGLRSSCISSPLTKQKLPCLGSSCTHQIVLTGLLEPLRIQNPQCCRRHVNRPRLAIPNAGSDPFFNVCCSECSEPSKHFNRDRLSSRTQVMRGHQSKSQPHLSTLHSYEFKILDVAPTIRLRPSSR